MHVVSHWRSSMRFSRACVVLGCALLASVACQSRYMTSGKVYMQQSNWEKAAEQLELEVQANPSNGEAYAYLAQCYVELGQYQKAGESFEKAKSLVKIPKKREQIEASQRHASGERMKRAFDLFNNEKYEEAAREYDIAIMIEPGYVEAHKNKAIALLRADKAEESKQSWSQVANLSARGSENWIMAHELLAKLALQSAAKDEALAHVDSVLSVQPDHLEMLNLKAGVLESEHRYEEALSLYQRIHQLAPDNIDALFNVGVLHYRLGHLEESEQAFENVVRAVPDDKEAQYNLGIMAMNLQRWAMARDAFQKVVELDPTSGEAWQNLGICLLNLGDTKGGKAAFARAAELGVH